MNTYDWICISFLIAILLVGGYVYVTEFIGFCRQSEENDFVRWITRK